MSILIAILFNLEYVGYVKFTKYKIHSNRVKNEIL